LDFSIKQIYAMYFVQFKNSSWRSVLWRYTTINK
jgi:hypothetical protein